MTTKKVKSKIQFSKAFAELESITQWFESGQADLDEGLKKYERAMELASSLREELELAENKITEIQTKYGKSGSPSSPK
jgi:exodeoxyribonuclease VII small subunit